MSRSVCLLLCAVAGCVEVPPPEIVDPLAIEAGAPVADSSTLDGLLRPDAGPMPDAASPDASPPDASPPDVEVLDGAQLDGAPLDGHAPDRGGPDASPPDAAPAMFPLAWRRPGVAVDLEGPQLVGDIDIGQLADGELILNFDLHNRTDQEVVLDMGSITTDNPGLVFDDPVRLIAPDDNSRLRLQWSLELGYNAADLSVRVGDRESSIVLRAMGYHQLFVAVGVQGVSYFSIDGGDTWRQDGPNVNQTLADVDCGGGCTLSAGPGTRGYREDGRCVAVGARANPDQGLILHTAVGDRWVSVGGAPPQFDRIAAGDAWYASAGAEVYRTGEPRDPDGWGLPTEFEHPVVDIAATGPHLVLLTQDNRPFWFNDFPNGESPLDPLDPGEPAWRAVGAGEGMLLLGGDNGLRWARTLAGPWVRAGGQPGLATVRALAATRRADQRVVGYATGAGSLWSLVDDGGEQWDFEPTIERDPIVALAAGEGRLVGFSRPDGQATPRFLTRALDSPWERSISQPQYRLYTIAGGRVCAGADALGPAPEGAQ